MGEEEQREGRALLACSQGMFQFPGSWMKHLALLHPRAEIWPRSRAKEDIGVQLIGTCVLLLVIAGS